MLLDKSFPEDFIFARECIDYITFSRKMFALQWWNCLFEIFFLLAILLKSSAKKKSSLLKSSLFLCVKNAWVKVACLLFMLFILFVRVKSFRLKIKTALIPSFILLRMDISVTWKQISRYQKRTILHTFSTIRHIIDVYYI